MPDDARWQTRPDERIVTDREAGAAEGRTRRVMLHKIPRNFAIPCIREDFFIVLDRGDKSIERAVLKQLEPMPNYQMLLTVPGIGPIIAWTIVLESGDLARFASVGNYASYCRCVDATRTSNDKKKSENNAKNGNAYLSWAYYEAAHFAIQFLPAAKRFYEKKKAQRNPILAMKALSHKIARASYYVMRDPVAFR